MLGVIDRVARSACALLPALLLFAAVPSLSRAQDRQDAVRDRDDPTEPAEQARAAAAPGEERERNGWAALPLASYSPETHLGLGAFGIYFFRVAGEPSATRPSSVAVVGLYTTRHQAIVELIPEIYWDDEHWHLWTKLDFRSFPDSFWGIGNHTPASAEERFEQVSYRTRAWLRHRIVEELYVGVRTETQYLSVTEMQENGLFDTLAIPGESGGWTVGLGLTVGWDWRDNAVDARSGGLYQLSAMTWHPAFFSDYEFSRLSADLRHFVPLGNTHTLALQLYGEVNVGNVPFQQMALLGGQDLMRGYFQGRYRDTAMLAAQAEWRFPLWWRFRGVLFAGAGDVTHHLGDYAEHGLKVAGGGGLRFSLNEQERLNLRVDLGVAPGSWGAYLSISEAF